MNVLILSLAGIDLVSRNGNESLARIVTVGRNSKVSSNSSKHPACVCTRLDEPADSRLSAGAGAS